eukprot:9485207-Pyramimonas_sp.AAC.1
MRKPILEDSTEFAVLLGPNARLAVEVVGEWLAWKAHSCHVRPLARWAANAMGLASRILWVRCVCHALLCVVVSIMKALNTAHSAPVPEQQLSWIIGLIGLSGNLARLHPPLSAARNWNWRVAAKPSRWHLTVRRRCRRAAGATADAASTTCSRRPRPRPRPAPSRRWRLLRHKS